MSLAIGVDPGNSGAIALVCSERGLLQIAALPLRTLTPVNRGKAKLKRRVDERALRSIVRAWSLQRNFAGETRIVAAVERMFSGGVDDVVPPGVRQAMGLSQGLVMGVLAAFTHETHTPTPQQWKRTYGLGKDKTQSEPMARRFVRGCPVVLGHDKAEAILLAHWALGALQLHVSEDDDEDSGDWPFPSNGRRTA
jgi:hypothetical protein